MRQHHSGNLQALRQPRVLTAACLQALFGTCAPGQLAGAFGEQIRLLKAAGSDAAGQVAHLVALEYLLSQRMPPSEVQPRDAPGLASLMGAPSWVVLCGG